MRNFVIVFFMTNLLLSTYFLDLWNSPNPASRALTVLSFSEGRTLRIDAYADLVEDKSQVGEHFYSDKAPLPTLMVIPFHEALALLGLEKAGAGALDRFPIYVWRPIGVEDGRKIVFRRIVPILWLGSFLCGSLPYALIVTLAFLHLRNRKTPLSPVVVAMLAFYGSFLFVFSGTFFNHLLSGLFLLCGYISLKESRFAPAGFFTGLSFLSEYTIGIAFPLWAILVGVKSGKGGALRFLAGAFPCFVFILLYNYALTGNPFTMLNAYHTAYGGELGQHYGFHLPSPEALWRLLVGGATGILVFAPVLCLGAVRLVKACSRPPYAAAIVTDYLAIFGFAFFVAIASFFTWWGGWSYGPRYLIPLAVLLMYETVGAAADAPFGKTPFLLFTGYGLVCSWVAKATLVYLIPSQFLHGKQTANTFFQVLLPEFMERRYNANNLLSLIFGMPPLAGAVLWIAAFALSTYALSRWYHALSRKHPV